MSRSGPALAAAILAASAATAAARDAGVEVKLWADAFDHGAPSAQGWFESTFRYDGRLGGPVFLEVDLVLNADTDGEVDRDLLYDPDDRALQRALFRFEDLALRFERGEVTLTVGKQRIAWGRTDTLKPADVVSPFDWTDPLHEERLAAWSARLRWEREAWNVDAALVPVFHPSRLPVLGGRWFDDTPLGPAPTQLAWGEVDFPATTWRNLQGGIRFGRRGGLTEWAGTVYRGFDDAARIAPVPGPPDPTTGVVPVRMDRTFPRFVATGADGLVLAGPVVVRAEASYVHFPSDGGDGYLLYVAEVEWTRGAWRAYGGWGDSVGGEVATSNPTALDQAFLPALFAGVAYGYPTEWNAGLDVVVGARDLDRWIRAAASWPVHPLVRLGGEVELLHGPADSFFGRWRENDRVRLWASFTY